MRFQNVCKFLLFVGIIFLGSDPLFASGKAEASSDDEEVVKDLVYFQKFYHDAAQKCQAEYDTYQRHMSEQRHDAKRQKRQHTSAGATDQEIFKTNCEILSIQAYEQGLVPMVSAQTLYEQFPLISLCLSFYDKVGNITLKTTYKGEKRCLPAGYLLPFVFPELSKYPVPSYVPKDIFWLRVSSLEDFLADEDEDTLLAEREVLFALYKEVLQKHFAPYLSQTGLTIAEIPTRLNVFLNLWCDRYTYLSNKLEGCRNNTFRFLDIAPILQESKPEQRTFLGCYLNLSDCLCITEKAFIGILPESYQTSQEAWNAEIIKNLLRTSESLLERFKELQSEMNVMDEFLEYVRLKEVAFSELYPPSSDK